MQILYGFIILISLQLIGDSLSTLLKLPIPGAVIGMLLLLIILIIRGKVDEPVAVTADGLIKYIGLLFVPAGAGVSLYLGLIAQEWLTILIATSISTMLTLISCAWLFQWLEKKD